LQIRAAVWPGKSVDVIAGICLELVIPASDRSNSGNTLHICIREIWRDHGHYLHSILVAQSRHFSSSAFCNFMHGTGYWNENPARLVMVLLNLPSGSSVLVSLLPSPFMQLAKTPALGQTGLSNAISSKNGDSWKGITSECKIRGQGHQISI
jgi:hypothetical protein